MITEGSPIARFSPNPADRYTPLPIREMYLFAEQYEQKREKLAAAVSELPAAIMGINALDEVTGSERRYRVDDRRHLQQYYKKVKDTADELSLKFETGDIDMQRMRTRVRELQRETSLFKQTYGRKFEENYAAEKTRREMLASVKETDIRQGRFLAFDDEARAFSRAGGSASGASLGGVPIGDKYDVFKRLDEAAKDIPEDITKLLPGSMSLAKMGYEERSAIMKDNSRRIEPVFASIWGQELSTISAQAASDRIAREKEAAADRGEKPVWKTKDGALLDENQYRAALVEQDRAEQFRYFANRALSMDAKTTYNFTPFSDGLLLAKAGAEANAGGDVRSAYGDIVPIPNTAITPEGDSRPIGMKAEEWLAKLNPGHPDNVVVRKAMEEAGYRKETVNTAGPLSPPSFVNHYYKDGKKINTDAYEKAKQALLPKIATQINVEETRQWENAKSVAQQSGYEWGAGKEFATEAAAKNAFLEARRQARTAMSGGVSPGAIAFGQDQAKKAADNLYRTRTQGAYSARIDGEWHHGLSYQQLMEKAQADEKESPVFSPAALAVTVPRKESPGGLVSGTISFGNGKVVDFIKPESKDFSARTAMAQHIAVNSKYAGTDNFTAEKPYVWHRNFLHTDGKRYDYTYHTVTVPAKGYTATQDGRMPPMVTKVHFALHERDAQGNLTGKVWPQEVKDLDALEAEIMNQSQYAPVIEAGKTFSAEDTKDGAWKQVLDKLNQTRKAR